MSASRMTPRPPPRSIGSIARILVRDQATILLAIGLFSLVLVNVMIQTRTVSGSQRQIAGREVAAGKPAEGPARSAAEAEIAAAVAPRATQPATTPSAATPPVSAVPPPSEAPPEPTSDELAALAPSAPPAPANIDPSRRRIIVGTFLRAAPGALAAKVVRVVPGESVSLIGMTDLPDGAKWAEVQGEHGRGYLPGFAIEEASRDRDSTKIIFGVVGGVIDGNTIEVAGRQVRLAGIVATTGPWNEQFRERMLREAPTVTCTPRENDRYRCITEDLVDLAELLLLNGAVRVDVDAPASYADREAEAQKSRRGLWRR